MTALPTTPGEADEGPAGRAAAWPDRASVMSLKSVASRKRTAAARLQGRAGVLLAEAADLDARAERLLTADERP
jgi:hypothetical protein